MAEKESLFQRLKQKGEKKFSEITNEILSNPRFASALGKAIQLAMQTKGKMDKNVQAILGSMNVPTRDDYDRLAERINALSKSVGEIELRVEKLINQLGKASVKGKQAKGKQKAK